MSMLLAVKTGRPNRVVLGRVAISAGFDRIQFTSPEGDLETPVSGCPWWMLRPVARRRIGVEEEGDLVGGPGSAGRGEPERVAVVETHTPAGGSSNRHARPESLRGERLCSLGGRACLCSRRRGGCHPPRSRSGARTFAECDGARVVAAVRVDGDGLHEPRVGWRADREEKMPADRIPVPVVVGDKLQALPVRAFQFRES